MCAFLCNALTVLAENSATEGLASLHAWSRTEGGQLRASVGIFYESEG